MFLKRLDVIGFKSFADQISMEFDKGITAVVGPNGSGKSNISDGIRWVLGEQSAKSLRGAKMEDVIFAGSETRKPLNFAEVTLILDNSDKYIPIDYTEISITRRVYRSGESEFFINKQPCRLKDIVDLFLDSGLGKEAYSIIGQGKVEEILSSKSEDRRVIFEEAAGVLKYKTRKMQAEKKLAETKENLTRVEDIIYELEQQIEPLKNQSAAAKTFLEKNEQLKKLEAALIVHEIGEIHEMWEQKKRQLRALEEKKNQYEKEAAQHKEHQEKLQQKLRAVDETLGKLQEQLLQTSELLEKTEGQKEVLKERQKHATINKDELKKTIAQLREKKAAYEQTLQSEQKRQKELAKEVSQTKAKYKKLAEKLKFFNENIAEKIEKLKADYIELLNEKVSVKNELRFLDDQLSSIQTRKEELLDNNRHLLVSRKELAARKEKLEQEMKECEQHLNENISQYKTLTMEIEKEEKAYQEKQTKLYEAYQLMQQIRSRKEILEDMEADFSGYFQGVREILKERNRKLSGIVGAVAELIHVPKKYEIAIETALAGALQHIVTETEEDARMAIQFLKKHHYGRATFLPLSVIKHRSIASELESKLQMHRAFVGMAATVINYEKRFFDVMHYLLGNVIVASDLEGANEIARLVHYKYKIVTLDGDIVNPGGSMTGGSIKQNRTSLLGRKREIEQLAQKLSELEANIRIFEQKIKRQKESLEEKKERLENVRHISEKIREQLQNLQVDYTKLQHEEKTLNEQLSLFDRHAQTLTTEENEANERKRELIERKEQLALELKTLQTSIENYEVRRKEQLTQKTNVEEEIMNVKIQLAKAEERHASETKNVQRLKEELTLISQQLQDEIVRYEHLEKEMEHSVLDEETFAKQIEKYRKQKEEMMQQIAAVKKERTKIEEEMQFENDKEREKQFQLQYVQDEYHQCEVTVNRLDVELDKLLEKLQVDYELSYERAKTLYRLSIPLDEAKTKAKLIKREIEALGTVNLGAIDEYERVFERYQFLQEQKEDLEKAKATLYQVISEMDEEMTKRFKETFDDIRHHFQHVFKKLFGGGEADLLLTNENELLNTGVEIVAKPPGKKLKNLALLSGGERALTAIALLFAILHVRPVPFCVLDEVEAALDEANVTRFAKYLREFSDKTQFIVITHRKGTMEEADVLYGVTMQESGVSKLVSVRLEETEEILTR